MDFFGEIKGGQIELPAALLKPRERFLASMKDGTQIIETITKRRRHKTHLQCKTIFGLALAQIVDGFDDAGWDCSMLLNMPKPTGVPIDKDMLLKFFYCLFPTYENDKLITLSKMSTVQAADFFEKIRNFASSQWGIYIDEPNPEWRDKK